MNLPLVYIFFNLTTNRPFRISSKWSLTQNKKLNNSANILGMYNVHTSKNTILIQLPGEPQEHHLGEWSSIYIKWTEGPIYSGECLKKFLKKLKRTSISLKVPIEIFWYIDARNLKYLFSFLNSQDYGNLNPKI